MVRLVLEALGVRTRMPGQNLTSREAVACGVEPTTVGLTRYPYYGWFCQNGMYRFAPRITAKTRYSMHRRATVCESAEIGYNGVVARVFRAFGGFWKRPDAFFDKLGVTGSSPVSPTHDPEEHKVLRGRTLRTRHPTQVATGSRVFSKVQNGPLCVPLSL